MIGAELMRDAALLGAECVVAAPADQVPAADDGWTARPQARPRCARGCARTRRPTTRPACGCATSSGSTRPRTGSSCSAPPSSCYPEAAAAVSLLTEDARAQLPTPTVVALLAAGITRRCRSPRRWRRRSTAGPPAGSGSSRCIEPVPGLPHSQHALRSCSRELTAAARRARDARRAPRTGRSTTVVRRPPRRRSTPTRVRRAAAPARPPPAARRPRPVARGGRQLACDIAVAGRLDRQLRDRRRASCRGPSELARVRDGLLVLDLHRADPAAAGAARVASRRLGPAAGPRRRDRRRRRAAAIDVAADRLPGGAARLGAARRRRARARDWPPAIRVGVEEARSAVREARDLDDAERARPTSGHRRRSGRPPDPRAGRPPHGPARQRRRDVDHASPTSSCPTELRAPARRDRRAGSASSHRVRWSMDLGAGDPIGIGLTCLFAGKSGTGKTFAARCLAGELGLNLYRIDLSQVVSKYIGETEKALAQVFDEVEAGHGLLLFDEADALFGRRSEVKDAHDRYANIEVGYLLQRLETYDGHRRPDHEPAGQHGRRVRPPAALHPAVPRRPTASCGCQLWERSLPGAEWRDDDLDLDVLADRFQLNGGAIHNIGLAAAHLAAATPVGPDHLGARRCARPSASCRRPGARPTPPRSARSASSSAGTGRADERRSGCASTTSPSRSAEEQRAARGRGDAAHGARAARHAAGRGAARRGDATRRCGRSSCSSSGRWRPTGSPVRAPPRAWPTSSTSGSWGRRDDRRHQLPARRVHRLRARRLSRPASA